MSVGFMTRMQIDLIDMRSVEHGGHKWIFHAKDHFSKYSWLRPLMSKEAVNVAGVLKSIFYQFGPPRILQSDNGREFVAKVITDLTKWWPGLLIVNGRPRHPQSQGLVERGNAVVQQLLGKWMDANATADWPSGLGPVMFAINTSIARTINQTPFEVVFGQQPRVDNEIWEKLQFQLKERRSGDDPQSDHQSHVMLEEDLPADVLELLKGDDDAEEALSESEVNDLTARFKSANVVSKVTTDDQRATNDEYDVQSGSMIDHEELVDVTTVFPQAVENDDESSDHHAATSITCSPVPPRNENRHKRIRESAEEAYLNNARSETNKYIGRSSKRQRTYVVGDIVGLKVPDVDRTNTSSTLLPCKIIDCKVQGEETFYNVATCNGILSESFLSTALIDLRSSNFTALRIIDTNTLSKISFIQACHLHTSFRSSKTCKCNGNCSTNRCRCKKENRKCCSKCHIGDGSQCENC